MLMLTDYLQLKQQLIQLCDTSLIHVLIYNEPSTQFGRITLS